MAWTSLLGGLSLANAGLGAVHGFAGPIGGMFHAPHGAICARLLPLVFSANANAIQEREPGNPVLPRFKEVARILVGSMDAEIRDGALWLETLAETLKIPSLSSYGINLDDLDEIVQKSMAASSMKANPIGLTRAELRSILERAL
jgi:alcohol dehydrogenase class IV